MNKYLRLWVITFLSLLLIESVSAEVLATHQLLTPLIPDAQSHMAIAVPASYDLQKPVWVVYQLVAISADAEPKGEIVVDSSFEGIPLPLADSILVFKAKDMKIEKSAGALDEQVRAQIGERSSEEMQELLGAEMYAAYKALSKQEGSYVIGSLTETYQVGKQDGLVLLTSVERAQGIQPLMLNVIVGHGEIPEHYRKSFGSSLEADKVVAAFISFLVAIFFIFRRK